MPWNLDVRNCFALRLMSQVQVRVNVSGPQVEGHQKEQLHCSSPVIKSSPMKQEAVNLEV